jgi:hypothetical protein
MKLNHILRSGLVAVACILATGALQAQSIAPRAVSPWAGPLTVEGYYARYRLDTSGDDRIGMSGLGGRLMWSGALRFAGVESLPSRSAVGIFAEYAPTQDGFAIIHAGAEGDVSLAPKPLFGRVTPIASLAAGALWIDVDDKTKAIATGFPLAARRGTTFALTPSAGLRIGLWRELGLRADVRDVMTFRHQTLNNLQFATGLSFVF